MLTPEQIADGWKPHDGGPCPVAPEAWVTVLFRNGEISKSTARFWAYGRHNWWGRDKEQRKYHIIAYREEPSDAA